MSKNVLQRMNWPNTTFLVATLLLAVTLVPWYLWTHDLDVFQILMFVFFYFATGMSITLGYHRLFSHLSFKTKSPVRWFTVFMGAGAFEGSVLEWSADHRRHHKHVDTDGDPYDIGKGFFHAHVGWLLFAPTEETPMDNVEDLKKSKLLMFQHRHYVPIAFAMGFGLPTLMGAAWGHFSGAGVGSSALASLLVSGILRVVVVQHFTFFINSLCHMVGKRPYSTDNTARDSAIMALFTYGEGYHNYHHQFQHDYRNAIKPWGYDPTKWAIWALDKVGMASGLRRVSDEKILQAEIREQQKRFDAQLEAKGYSLPDSMLESLHASQDRLSQAMKEWTVKKEQYQLAMEKKIETSRHQIDELKKEAQEASRHVQEMFEEWKNAHFYAQAQMA
ncbi:MAG: fatty acid desaturase [Verrucomicrobiales bacterium]|nr:fatty acid desaturase [Verrucomicrobiales bacterium]